MKKLLTTVVLALSVANLNAQENENSWKGIEEKKIHVNGLRQIIPLKYKCYELAFESMKAVLQHAPHERVQTISSSSFIIYLPTPTGEFQRFRVVEAPVMAEELQASFPDIRTFSIRGIDDIYANGKLDITEFGLHVMVRSVNGDFFIDPYCLNNVDDYISYYTADFRKDPSLVIPESGLIVDKETENDQKKPAPSVGAAQRPAATAPCVGTILRTYRLAVACTGEYAKAATGSVTPTLNQTLAKVVTSVNRVSGVYESEIAVRLSLVPSTTLVLYTDPATDSFTGTANNNANVLIGLSQSIITASIGSANFDIGHTFSTGGGGLANLGCVCINNQKARGITGSTSPVGDPYDIDYVAHEMGHQFGGNHTFNAITGNCNGNREPTACVEPGSGVTIMAYAGLCSVNNLSGNSIPYYHAFSYDEIVNNTNFSVGSSCAVSSTTGNQPPVVTAATSFVIPKSTPFYLTGSATDPDNDPLTYSWEEIDLGPVAGNWNSGFVPFFRSYPPVTTPTRMFPRANVVASGNYTGTIGEFLPNSAQVLDFRLTVRDNKPGGGGVCYAKTQVIVDSTGPFQVLYPSATGINWVVNTLKTITWDPAQTDQLPVACDSVRILISYNSGANYSVLVNSVQNSGWYTVTVPNLSTTIGTCRIKVESIGNVFYDIGNSDFTISTDPYVGVSETSENNLVALSIQPNPSSGIYYVQAGNLSQSEQSTLTVNDLVGRTLVTKKFEGLTIHEQLDLSALSSGVYIVSLNSGGKHASQHIVKE